MKNHLAPMLLATAGATIVAASSAGAFALTDADHYGVAANARFTQRTIVIDDSTRWVNVMHGETVTIRKGDTAIAWYFDGLDSAFALSKILPAADGGKPVEVYVAPELNG